jgi:hypothetical protein
MRKYRSEEEWRELFAEQERSGQSAKGFCQSEGVSANVFYRKKRLLRDGGGLVRLPVGLEKGAPIEITVGAVTIGVRGGFGDHELVRVLRCVREALDA